MALGLADREGKREFGVILLLKLGLHASNLCLELGGVAVEPGPHRGCGIPEFHIVYLTLLYQIPRNSIN